MHKGSSDNYFKDKPNNPNVKHDCCDVCLAACKCSSCNTLEKPSDIKPANETVEITTVVRFELGEQGIEAIVS